MTTTTTTTTEREAIEACFDRLRGDCDPRGWDLLDALKDVMLAGVDVRETATEAVKLLTSAHQSIGV